MYFVVTPNSSKALIRSPGRQGKFLEEGRYGVVTGSLQIFEVKQKDPQESIAHVLKVVGKLEAGCSFSQELCEALRNLNN